MIAYLVTDTDDVYRKQHFKSVVTAFKSSHSLIRYLTHNEHQFILIESTVSNYSLTSIIYTCIHVRKNGYTLFLSENQRTRQS